MIQANEEYYEAKLSTARNFFKMAGNVYFFTKMTDETGTESLTTKRTEPRTDERTDGWYGIIEGALIIPKKLIEMEMPDLQFLQKMKILK